MFISGGRKRNVRTYSGIMGERFEELEEAINIEGVVNIGIMNYKKENNNKGIVQC